MTALKTAKLERRRQRHSFRLRQHNRLLPRLVIFRSNEQIYAQVIDDLSRRTVASASSLPISEAKAKTAKAQLVGTAIAERALALGVTKVVFDRRGRRYHGRIKALAEAAREKGLTF